MSISVIGGLLTILIIVLVISTAYRKLSERKGKILAEIPLSTRKKAKFAMIIVGVFSITVAVMGIRYNIISFSTNFSGFMKGQNITYFYPAFYTMSCICIACYICILICGVQFLRLRTGLIKLFTGVVIFEIIYFVSIGTICLIPNIGVSVAAAMGVANGGLMFQVFTLFPLWAPFLAGWAAKRI